MRRLAWTLVTVASVAAAEETGDFRPAETNVWAAQYPRVEAAGRVQVRIKAPEATKVRVNFWSGPREDMSKQADGFWTVTTPPLVPRPPLLHARHRRRGSRGPWQPRLLWGRQARERGGGPGAGLGLLLDSPERRKALLDMTAVFEADVIEALIPFVDRTHELGLRFALGATRAQVLGLVMRDGLATALVGTALGFVGAFWLGRAMQGMFEGVPGLDTV